MRRSKVNELYYAKDNTPSFYQFKQNYHFIDDQGRQYMIVTKNRQMFQNTRFKNTQPSSRRHDLKEPVINNYDYVKLYVKLGDPSLPWFGHKDINHSLLLFDKHRVSQYLVILKSHEKHNVKRRTGIIYVKGLGREVLLRLLNS